MKAIWNGRVIAESTRTIVVENNHYFPPTDVNDEYLAGSATHTSCPWKGEACYYTIRVDGEENRDGAWYFPRPRNGARVIRNYVAFWRGVQIIP